MSLGALIIRDPGKSTLIVDFSIMLIGSRILSASKLASSLSGTKFRDDKNALSGTKFRDDGRQILPYPLQKLIRI